jgi:hypothetical protein
LEWNIMPAGCHVSLDVHASTDFAGRTPFGQSGSYKKIVGRACFAIDPHDPGYASLTDLHLLAPGKDGLIRFAGDFTILCPMTAARGNHRLLFEWCNRGNKLALGWFNDALLSNDPATQADAGNGFLFRRGYALAWLAWQGDLLPGDGRMLLDVPSVHASPAVTGLVRREFIVEEPGTTMLPLSGSACTMAARPAGRDPSRASLVRRRYPGDPPQRIDSSCWALVDDEYLSLDGGFEPGWIYELVYDARDPRVLGLGFAAVREFIAFLRRESNRDKNPLAGSLARVYGWGHSQSARALREFIYRGYNDDGTGKRLYDGVLVHGSGAGRITLAERFANGSAMGGQQYEEHFNSADRFPFAYAPCTDHNTGKSDAILRHAETDPLVMHVQTASEYWQRHASLVHTDTRGKDLDQPAGVRIYHVCSSQHAAPVAATPVPQGICQLPVNALPSTYFLRPMLDALDAWASMGTLPPPSLYPKRSDGTLVEYEAWRRQYPDIGAHALPTAPNRLALLDFGPNEQQGILSIQPPRIIAADAYAVLVPAVDDNGNETGGIRAPALQVPRATYTGWNLRGAGQGEGAMYLFTGSMIPFQKAAGEASSPDSRKSPPAQRSGVSAVHTALICAAEHLCQQGFLLEDDVELASRSDGLAPETVSMPGARNAPV